MLVKLMKHEFKATFRTYLTINAGVILLSVLLGISVNFENDFVVGLLTLGWIGFLAAAPIICIIQCIRIFTKDLFSPIGYLNLTLPVKTSLLLISKFIVLILWTLITYLTMFASSFLFILIAVPDALANLDQVLTQVQIAIAQLGIPPEVYLTSIFSLVVSLISTMMLIGVSTTVVRLGNFSKGQNFISIVTYFVTSYILSFIMQTISVSFTRQTFTVFDLIDRSHYYYDAIAAITASNIISVVFYTIVAIASFFITVYLIDNKIEIQ